MSVLDDLASKLVVDGICTLGGDLFLGSKAVIPSGDGPYTSLNEVGGVAPTRVQNKAAANTKRPTVQVLVRAKLYNIARDKVAQVYASLDGVFNTTLNGVFYVKVTARQEPTDMGVDATGNRVQLVFNLEAEKQ
jgi:hypothetical protein